MRVGFYGLGNMGGAMATNLVRAGHEVVVFNRTIEKAEPLRRVGARVARSPGELADAEVIVTMLADDAAVEAAALDRDRPGAMFARGAVHLSMSTISVALSRRLTDIHRREGGAFVAAPVFGRPEAAQTGKLFVVAAGARDIVDRCEPLLSTVGQRTFVVGEDPPAANVLKLAGNFLIGATIQSMAEAFALARKSGLDAEQLLEVLTGSIFTAPVHEGYGGSIARGAHDASGGFALALGLKDLRLVLAAADAAGVPMPTASLVHDQLLSGAGRGMALLDWSVLGKLAAENAGL